MMVMGVNLLIRMVGYFYLYENTLFQKLSPPLEKNGYPNNNNPKGVK